MYLYLFVVESVVSYACVFDWACKSSLALAKKKLGEQWVGRGRERAKPKLWQQQNPLKREINLMQ